MRTRSRRISRLLRTLLLVSVLLIGAVGTAPTASAHGWTEPYSWGNSDTLGRNYLNHGNMVAAWQRMMHAQFSNGCPGNFGCTYRTDGIFGTNTHNLTLWWQATYKGLVPSMLVDGIVGQQTWNVARFFNLRRTGGDSAFDYYCYGVCGLFDPGLFMRYVKPYATWQADPWFCGYSNIDHPNVAATWLYGCW